MAKKTETLKINSPKKHSVRYDTKDPVIVGTVYLLRAGLGDKIPTVVHLTVEWED